MTEVRYNPYRFTLEVEGHANAGEFVSDGYRDLCCCAISTLTESLRMMFEGHPEYRGIVEANPKVAYFRAEADPRLSALTECNTVYQFVITGLKGLAQEYPQAIKITMEKGDDD